MVTGVSLAPWAPTKDEKNFSSIVDVYIKMIKRVLIMHQKLVNANLYLYKTGVLQDIGT